MSLFQPKIAAAGGTSPVDTVPLHQLGCEAVFSRYEAGQSVGPVINISRARNLLVTGAAILETASGRQTVRAGEWMELPVHKDYTVHYLSDSLVIEFWFDSHPH